MGRQVGEWGKVSTMGTEKDRLMKENQTQEGAEKRFKEKLMKSATEKTVAMVTGQRRVGMQSDYGLGSGGRVAQDPEAVCPHLRPSPPDLLIPIECPFSEVLWPVGRPVGEQEQRRAPGAPYPRLP